MRNAAFTVLLGKAPHFPFLCAERRLDSSDTHSFIFAPQKMGYGLPLCLGVKKGVECFSRLPLFSRCCEARVFSRWRFFRRAWQAFFLIGVFCVYGFSTFVEIRLLIHPSRVYEPWEVK